MKKGAWTIEQVGGLILAVAVVVVLFLLSVRLFSPIFDRGDETAKSYFNTLEGEIEVADGGGVGEFFMWYLGDSDREYYLVYFGETIEVDFVKQYFDKSVGAYGAIVNDEVQFNSFGTNDNRICICIVKGYESNCNYCEDLDYPVSFVGKGEIWYEESGKRISIELKEDKYVFTGI